MPVETDPKRGWNNYLLALKDKQKIWRKSIVSPEIAYPRECKVCIHKDNRRRMMRPNSAFLNKALNDISVEEKLLRADT